MRKLLFTIFVLILYQQAFAISGVDLKVELINRRKDLRFSVDPQESAASCMIFLYGARKSSSLVNLKSENLLLSLEGKAESSVLVIRNVPKLRGSKKSLPFFFKASVNCPNSDANSKIVSLQVRTTLIKEAFSESRWLRQLATRLSGDNIKITKVFENLSFTHPLDLQNAGDNSGMIYIVEQEGKIWQVDSKTETKNLFLDISDKISTGGELGLLGLAFHPQFKSNRFFFVNYTEKESGQTVIARYKAAQSPSDPTSELRLLTVPQPFPNHNGGGLAFGPDGFLYIGLGDGGSAGDPHENAQNIESLLGKMLRINVDKQSAGKNYSIPESNPFIRNKSGFKEEIFAYGLRNPFRFSFDKITGKLWAGDVGQNAREEIDIVLKGKNYGWNIMEGQSCFSPASGCSTQRLTLSILDYPHSDGASVTGGFVYRGKKIPSLIGTYIFGDFISGKIWKLLTDNGSISKEQLFDTNSFISSFGVDEDQELYFLSYIDGSVYRFE